jgi:hypothetical protein
MNPTRDKRAVLKFGRLTVPVPRNKALRLGLGWVLTAAGFLPIIGWGFLPLGLLVLSVDSPMIRRARRRLEVWWFRPSHRRERGSQKERAGSEPGPKALGNGGVSSREDGSNMPL